MRAVVTPSSLAQKTDPNPPDFHFGPDVKGNNGSGPNDTILVSILAGTDKMTEKTVVNNWQNIALSYFTSGDPHLGFFIYASVPAAPPNGFGTSLPPVVGVCCEERQTRCSKCKEMYRDV